MLTSADWTLIREALMECRHDAQRFAMLWKEDADALAAIDTLLAKLDGQGDEGWKPVDFILNDDMSIDADELAVTIGRGNTALATFVWPDHRKYAVCVWSDHPAPQPPTVQPPSPDWTQAKNWANYWTRDVSGVTMWWETKPFYDGRIGAWMCEDESRRARGIDLAVIRQRPAPSSPPATEVG